MIKRPNVYLSRAALAGLAVGAALGFLLAALLPAGPVRLGLAVGAFVSSGYMAGVLVACRRRGLQDLAYILRLREELRLSQDHIMETATFQSLAAYLDACAPDLRERARLLAAAVAGASSDTRLPEDVRGAVGTLQTHVQALQEAIGPLADYAWSRPARAPFSVNSLLREAIDLVRHRAEEKKISFDERYALVPPVFGPAGRILQGLQALVINAVEAMPFGGGTIVVETVVDGDRVVARIRDGGLGIRPEHMPRVFDPFFTTKPEKNGVGLGLWTARRMLGIIGAEVGLRSTPHQGTEVTVVFPEAAPLRPGRTGVDHPPEIMRNTAEDRGRQIA